ncbi:methyltransferase domain-containing protein [Nonomuraea thailandensis]
MAALPPLSASTLLGVFFTQNSRPPASGPRTREQWAHGLRGAEAGPGGAAQDGPGGRRARGPGHAGGAAPPVRARRRAGGRLPRRADRDQARRRGLPISSSSQPAIMATMLGQLGVEPGHRVLEIGAGTGYNAALLAYLVGPGGHVVALDLDEDTAEEARRHLDAAGVAGVEVVCRDGAGGHPERAPYDRLIATVGVWDLAPAWLAQLGPGGRLVVPLDLRGVQVSAAMERDGERWVSRSVAPCGFMRMRGSLTGTETIVVVRRDPGLMLLLPEPREVGDVRSALEAAPTEITVRREEPAPPLTVATGVALWLALHEPHWCVVNGDLGGGPGGGPASCGPTASRCSPPMARWSRAATARAGPGWRRSWPRTSGPGTRPAAPRRAPCASRPTRPTRPRAGRRAARRVTRAPATRRRPPGAGPARWSSRSGTPPWWWASVRRSRPRRG